MPYISKLVTVLLSFSHSWLCSPSVHSWFVITMVTLITSLTMTNNQPWIQLARGTVPFIYKRIHDYTISYPQTSSWSNFGCLIFLLIFHQVIYYFQNSALFAPRPPGFRVAIAPRRYVYYRKYYGWSGKPQWLIVAF